ncbi:MAG: hypothetical protein ACRDRH_27250 [Pseudonocardia sp.]
MTIASCRSAPTPAAAYRGVVWWGGLQTATTAVAAVVLAVWLGACATTSGGPESLPVPTFAASTAEPGANGPMGVDPGIPNDCERVLAAADLGALLGLPLDSVAVRSTVDVPAPSVGRSERLVCRYTGTASGPVGGMTLLDLNAGLYVDEQAAAEHWMINAEAEDGARRRLPIGSAPAVLLQRPAESLLTAVNGPATLTLVLPARAPRPGGRTSEDVLLDLALRTLVTITPPAPSTTSEVSARELAAVG